jgi:rhodanese-related sulfurtransferase
MPEDPEKNRINIPLKTLYKDFEKLDKNKRIYIFCGSGNRATTAASYLKVRGYEVVVITGGATMYRNL